jgi:hypothetical protein
LTRNLSNPLIRDAHVKAKIAPSGLGRHGSVTIVIRGEPTFVLGHAA